MRSIAISSFVILAHASDSSCFGFWSSSVWREQEHSVCDA